MVDSSHLRMIALALIQVLDRLTVYCSRALIRVDLALSLWLLALNASDCSRSDCYLSDASHLRMLALALIHVRVWLIQVICVCLLSL